MGTSINKYLITASVTLSGYWSCLSRQFSISPMKKRLAPGTGLFYIYTVYPKKYAHGFVVLCFVVVMQPFIMNLHEVFIHIHQGCFAGTGAIVRLPQCQWSKPDGYGKISQCITTTKHSKAKTVCIFLGIYYISIPPVGYQQTWLKFTQVTIRHDLFCFVLFFVLYFFYNLRLLFWYHDHSSFYHCNNDDDGGGNNDGDKLVTPYIL